MNGATKPRILIVEDQESWQEIYQDSLGADYSITTAYTFLQAEQKLKNPIFDLAIVDPKLDQNDPSNLDGIKIIRRIATLDAPFPVIVITGDPNSIEDTIEKDDPLLKGFIAEVLDKTGPELHQLAHMVKRHLKIRQAHTRWLRLSQGAPALTVYDGYKKMLSQLLDRTKADIAHLLVPDATDHLEIIVDTGQDEGRRIPIFESVTGQALAERKPILYGDTQSVPHYKQVSGLQGFESMPSELAVPVLRDNDVVGVLNIESKRPHAFDDRHIDLMETVADLTVIMTQNERRQTTLEEFQRLGRAVLRAGFESENVWRSILEAGVRMVDANVGFLATQVDDQTLAIKAATINSLSGIPFNITNSIAKDAIASIPQRIEGGHQSAESQLIHEFAGLADASLLVVSLRQEVPTKGVLCFAAARPHIFTEEHEKLILFLADYMSFAILLEQQAQHSKIVEGQKQQIALAGDLLHRASNPIFSIRDWLYTIGVDDLIRMERDLPNVAEAIEMIQISVKRLLNVTYELSNLVRPVLLKPVDVNASIEAALEAVSSYSKAKNWQAQRLLAPTSPLTLADHRLQEVFRALLENAIDALPEQGRIQVITKVHDGVVITSISDNGHGIAPEHLPRIFDPFFSTKNPRKPIDGLGLFVCQRYVEDAWKGKIKVEKSEIGNGTTFVVTLPIHQLEDIYSAADR